MRQKRVVFGLILAPVVLIGGAWGGIEALDRTGVRYYHTGRAVVGTLHGLAAALKARDTAAAGRYYGADFRGTSLGLNGLAGLNGLGRVSAKDGVWVLRFRPTGTDGTGAPLPQDHAVALAAWQDYLAGFESIDELALHLDRVDDWDDEELSGRVRFELIGTPRGASQAGIDRAYFHMRFARPAPAAGFEIVAASLDTGDRVISDRPQFVDVGPAAGIAFHARVHPSTVAPGLRYGVMRYGGAGLSAADYDDDGFYDLFIGDGVSSRLLRNRGDGTFEDVTDAAGLAGLDTGSAAVFADYDNDGHKDLFVSHFRRGRSSQLFHNDGDGTFTDVTAQAGLRMDDCCTTVATWGDYDNDGSLDLFVGRYLDPFKSAPVSVYTRNGEGDRLYHNNRNGTFTDVTEETGVGDTGLCLAAAWGDYDNDGDPDLYVVNDFGRSTLFRNDGDGTFEDTTVHANALAYGAGMNASFADYDNDGWLDLYTTDIRSEYAWFAATPSVGRYLATSLKQGAWRANLPLFLQIFRQSGTDFPDVFQQMTVGNHLLHNRHDGTFEEVTQKAGANPVGWFWGASFADFDNDGWLDVYAADGWIYNQPGTELELDFFNDAVSRQVEYQQGDFFQPEYFGNRSWHGYERNRHLRNRGDGTFEEIGRAAGTDLVTASRGVAAADFWNRGVLDIAVSAVGDRHVLLRNEIDARRHWLQVELTGTRTNRDAVGARVMITAGGKRQMREVTAGDGYASQNPLRLHFGLGNAATVDEITVRWPVSGQVETFRHIAADRLVHLEEGSGRLVEKRYPNVAPALPAPPPAAKGALPGAVVRAAKSGKSLQEATR